MKTTRFIQFWRGLNLVRAAVGSGPASVGQALAAWQGRAVAGL